MISSGHFFFCLAMNSSTAEVTFRVLPFLLVYDPPSTS